ncbi:MAG: phospholipase C, phosphocholine-specific [Methylovulum sp.]|uniref:phosphocholine-specific phospholipase C n=1 Tax=Methylovulum sp. TaxID=1916980 RepID=UPI002631BD7A|nr:phospholipase C, phosphocholine-specific [Methylovulum sp.]MDD2722884.1 phospholipase C, phosphocholine-specific [Methylovulum sp.]MDD5125045.1 phospholipase C, phosphocholine-specific [Methylovulum sp.]
MKSPDRRKFLQVMGTGTLIASLPASIAKAMAIPANNRTGTIKDIEHIIILTQENRSFDHYFGTLRGIRGFADPRAVTLPSGKSVWHQPNGTDELLPFRPPVDNLGMTFLSDPPHGWNDTHAAWNQGNHDQWVPNKGAVAMTYHTRKDIPYHFALADAFTICDAYHCSLMGPTDPNRYHMWTGWVGNDGQGGGPVITNAEAGYDWLTYPERLQKAGITWKIYQDIGDGLNADNGNWWGWTGDPYIGNYGDNSLLFFHQYQNAAPGDPLADYAKTGTEIKALRRNPRKLFDIFRDDVRNNKLPQVSWIAAPEAYTEHPNFPANYGAWFISQFIEILASNPDVWSKTALFINYDEEGGFFDHTIPPTPAQNAQQGDSTVDTINEIYPGDPSHPSAPYGLGMRVPMIVVSPWTKGGWVNSQVFDHTSLIRFLEARFGDEYPDLIETNITPWRRAVAGDLTSIFNFTNPNTVPAYLPSTAAFLPPDKKRHPDYPTVPPTTQELPGQEQGIRPARALPYALTAHGKANTTDGTFAIDFANIGTATAVFHVRSGDSTVAPRSYTVEPKKNLLGSWNSDAGYYDLSVYGPNGFLRSFKGQASDANKANLDVQASYHYNELKTNIRLDLINLSAQTAKIRVFSKYSGNSFIVKLKAGASLSKSWKLLRFLGWYDLVITVEGDTGFEYRLAGHVETGKDSYSDPIMGGLCSSLTSCVSL